jgi:hypothetical protein
MTQTTPQPHFAFKWWRNKKIICQPSYLPNTATANIVLFQIGEIRAGKPFAVPGRPHDELGGGHPNHQQKQVRRQLMAVDGPLQKVCPNWL